MAGALRFIFVDMAVPFFRWARGRFRGVRKEAGPDKWEAWSEGGKWCPDGRTLLQTIFTPPCGVMFGFILAALAGMSSVIVVTTDRQGSGQSAEARAARQHRALGRADSG